MSLEDFLNAAKRGNIDKLNEELRADPTIINSVLDHGLLGGRTALELAASGSRVNTVIYLLNNGAEFRENNNNGIIANLLPRGTTTNLEIARIRIFNLMLNNNVNISEFQAFFSGVEDFTDLVNLLRQGSRNLSHLSNLSDNEFIELIFRDEDTNDADTDHSSPFSTQTTNTTDSENSENNNINILIGMQINHNSDDMYT